MFLDGLVQRLKGGREKFTNESLFFPIVKCDMLGPKPTKSSNIHSSIWHLDHVCQMSRSGQFCDERLRAGYWNENR